MKTKKIKVVYSNRYSSGTGCVPKIQMEGKWLEALGFSIGTPLILEYSEGTITIRLLTAEEAAIRKQQELQTELNRRKTELDRVQKNLEAEYSRLSMVAEP